MWGLGGVSWGEGVQSLLRKLRIHFPRSSSLKDYSNVFLSGQVTELKSDGVQFAAQTHHVIEGCRSQMILFICSVNI